MFGIASYFRILWVVILVHDTTSVDRETLLNKLHHYDIVENIYMGATPSHVVNVTWDTGVSASLGNEIMCNEILQEPKMSWPVNKVYPYYTLLLTDLDDPQDAVVNWGEHMLWVVYNIPGTNISEGVVCLSYITPAPKQFNHLILASVLCQTRKTSVTETYNTDFLNPGRDDWTVSACMYDFEAAVHASNFFYVTPTIENPHPRFRSSTSQQKVALPDFR